MKDSNYKLCLMLLTILSLVLCPMVAIADDADDRIDLPIEIKIDGSVLTEDAIHSLGENEYILLAEGTQTFPINLISGDDRASSQIYTINAYYAVEYWLNGVQCRVVLECDNPGCQLYEISGTVLMRDYSDWEYGEYDLYGRPAGVAGPTLSATAYTGEYFPYGVSNLYVYYDYNVYVLQGQIMPNNHITYTAGPFSF